MSHAATRGAFFPLWPEHPKLELEAGSASGSAISLRETITNTYFGATQQLSVFNALIGLFVFAIVTPFI